MDPMIILDIGSRLPLSELWGSAIGFIAIMVSVVTAIGFGARSLSIGAVGGYVIFVYYAIETGIQILQPLLYVTLALVIIGTSFKLWRAEAGGEPA